MPIVKGYTKMQIIYLDSLERSDTWSMQMLIIQMAIKRKLCQMKNPMQPELQKISRDMAELAVTRQVPQGVSRQCLCHLLPSSARSSNFHLFIVLVWVAAITSRVRCCNQFP